MGNGTAGHLKETGNAEEILLGIVSLLDLQEYNRDTELSTLCKSEVPF